MSASVFPRSPLLPLALLGILALPGLLEAHPVPDIPVRFIHEKGGKATIQVEVDMRCFDPDPEGARYILSGEMDDYTPEEKAELKADAAEFIRKSVEFYFLPAGRVEPELDFIFTTHEAQPFSTAEDPVMLTGNWDVTFPEGTEAYRIKARPEGKLSVVFKNTVRGESLERIHVLFPGEESYALDLTGVARPEANPAKPATENEETATPPAGGGGDETSTNSGSSVNGGNGSPTSFGGFVAAGYLAFVPHGLPHVLFVVLIVIFTRDWNSLLRQVLTFAVAAFVALVITSLAAGEGFSLPWRVPLLAATILLLSAGNFLSDECGRARYAILGVCGVVHGLSLTADFLALGPFASGRLLPLLGFDIGLDLGHLLVLGLTILATTLIAKPGQFRKYVTLPGTTAVILTAAGWSFGLWR